MPKREDVQLFWESERHEMSSEANETIPLESYILKKKGAIEFSLDYEGYLKIIIVVL